MKHLSHIFLFFLCSAFILRLGILFLSLFFPIHTDAIRYATWGKNISTVGFTKAYEVKSGATHNPLLINQPPGSVYIIFSLYTLGAHISKHVTSTLSPFLLLIFLRLPAIIADCILGVCIYLFVRKNHAERQALFSSLLFLFNPVIIYNSAFWGQMDAVQTAFFYLAIMFLLRKRYLLAVLGFFLSLYVKLTFLFLLPLFLFVLYRYVRSLKQTVFFVCIGFSFIYLLTLPITRQPLSWLFTFIIEHVRGESSAITVGAFNMWWLLFKPHIFFLLKNSASTLYIGYSPLSSQMYGIPLFLWGLILFGICVSPLHFAVYRIKKISEKQVFLVFSLYASIGFLFLPHIHERYLYVLFPLLATYYGLSRQFLRVYILCSILNFLNIYAAWHPVSNSFFTMFIESRNVQWGVSFMVVLVCAYFYYSSIKKLYPEKKGA